MGLVEDRRALHRIPELEWDLPETVAYVKGALAGLGCRVWEPLPNAVCAYFDFGQATALAFRGDMDALPVAERNTHDFVSVHPGNMHACGHDGHTAILLELARRLAKKASLPHNVLLIFQPGEESPGGAERICNTGVLEEYAVEAIFALHIWPGLEKGVLASREQEMMSRSSEVDVEIFGRSAHVAKAACGADALMAGAEFCRRAAAMEKALPPEIFRLLKFGRFESGTVRNAISAHTQICGTLRAFQDEIFDGMLRALFRIADEVGAEFDCRVAVRTKNGYPAVMNPAPLYRRVRGLVSFRALAEPTMTAEDFAFYQRRVPGLMFFLGAGDVPPLHADTFDFDESILTIGADFFEDLAEKL